MTTAFLIIDVQNAILEGEGTPERQPLIDAALDAVAARLATLKERALLANIPVVVVQHDGGEGSLLAAGTLGWAVRREVAPVEGDVLVHKQSPDSFFETDLAERLAERGVTRLVIGGCQTQFCIDTTARRAVSLGYDVTLVADGHTTADWGRLTFADIIDHHNATLNGFNAGPHCIEVRPAAGIAF